MKSSSTQFSNANSLSLSLKFAVRLESAGPNSQLNWTRLSSVILLEADSRYVAAARNNAQKTQLPLLLRDASVEVATWSPSSQFIGALTAA
jgi:hypothetical protein